MKGRGQQANDAAQGEAPGEQAALTGTRALWQESTRQRKGKMKSERNQA